MSARTDFYSSKLKMYARLGSEPPKSRDESNYLTSGDVGYYWFPVGDLTGEPTDEEDKAWWDFVNQESSSGGNPIPRITRNLDVFACGICLDTLYMPVMPLCMHVFCYKCLTAWFAKGRRTCPICRQQVEVEPIRDNAFEMALWDAICGGLPPSSDMKGKQVAGKDTEYNWNSLILS
ncbi:hypothetical protein B0H10DRAFT_2250060 [Mycena sp. CBHHK59/15]|nr:hypothetical protein B0H10DRAFT_2250060 [Mycena sp. CBHHK59/15]